MFNLDIGGACEAIREETANNVGSNYAFNMERQIGALDFVTDPEQVGVESQLMTWDNQKKIGQIKILYKQRTKPCEILTGDDAVEANICDPGEEPGIKTAFGEIDKRIATKPKKFTNEHMVVICEDTPKFIRDFLGSDLRAAREALSELVLAELDNQIGVARYADGTTGSVGSYKDLTLLRTEGGQDIPLDGNFIDFKRDYEEMQFSGAPAIIGNGNFDKYMQLTKMSCCNGSIPYANAVENAGIAYYKDAAANRVLGANRVIMATPGIARLITFNENRNIMIDTPTHKHITIPDPAGYPFDWDMDFMWDPCDKVWKFMYSMYWTLFNFFQPDSFKGNSPAVSPACVDENLGITGFWGYRAQKV